MTSCQVLSKGIFVEAGKKPPLGSKKQHLSIEGNDKQSVTNAANEIKRQIDELQMAQNSIINKSYTEGYSGKFGQI